MIERPERLIYDQGSRSYIHFTVSQQSKGRKGMVVGFFAKPSLGEWWEWRWTLKGGKGTEKQEEGIWRKGVKNVGKERKNLGVNYKDSCVAIRVLGLEGQLRKDWGCQGQRCHSNVHHLSVKVRAGALPKTPSQSPVLGASASPFTAWKQLQRWPASPRLWAAWDSSIQHRAWHRARGSRKTVKSNPQIWARKDCSDIGWSRDG